MILAGVVFIAVFGLFAVLLFIVSSGGSQAKKQVSARLDSVLLKAHKSDEDVSVRKQDTLSTIPLLNRLLASLEIAPKLRDLLAQDGRQEGDRINTERGQAHGARGLARAGGGGIGE